MGRLQQILSVSRRSDIPAFHYDWLQGVLRAGKVSYPHPLLPDRTVSADLSPASIHSIVLWSKDFRAVAREPGVLAEYPLYFHYTITAYGARLEPQVPDYAATLRTLEQLRRRYAARQFNIRFDPLLESVGADVHGRRFRQLCADLLVLGYQGCRITTSLFSPYRHALRRLARSGVNLPLPEMEQRRKWLAELAAIAGEQGFSLYACATDSHGVPGIERGCCIDGPLLEELFGGRVSRARASGQRADCNCSPSRDIGSYEQKCGHGCLYCYAR